MARLLATSSLAWPLRSLRKLASLATKLVRSTWNKPKVNSEGQNARWPPHSAVRNGSGTGIPGTRDLTKIQCGIRETLTGYRIGSWILGFWLLSGKQDSPKFGQGCRNGKENDIRDSDKKSSGFARMQDRNSFSISDPIRTKECGHCIVMVQFNIPGGTPL